MRRAALLLLLSAPAFAWPVDWAHDVELAREKFVKLPRVDWFEVEDPSVAEVEWLPDSNELLISGKKPGATLVLFSAEGTTAVWRIRVGSKPTRDDAAWKKAEKACAAFEATPLDPVKLRVTVQSEACRQALLTLFQTDSFEARHLAVTFDGEVLQGQLRSLKAAVQKRAPQVRVSYLGAGLQLVGEVTRTEHRAVLWEAFRHSVGRLLMNDRLVVKGVVDAGVAETPVP